jgi:hypothetical protein
MVTAHLMKQLPDSEIPRQVWAGISVSLDVPFSEAAEKQEEKLEKCETWLSVSNIQEKKCIRHVFHVQQTCLECTKTMCKECAEAEWQI